MSGFSNFLWCIVLLLSIGVLALILFDDLKKRRAGVKDRHDLDEALQLWLATSDAERRMFEIDQEVLIAASDRVAAMRRSKMLSDLDDLRRQQNP